MTSRVQIEATPGVDPSKVPEGAQGDASRVTVGDPPPVDPNASKSTPPERPEWLPEKFESAEALATAYAALEKKQGAAKPVEGDATPTPAEAVTQAGLDMDAVRKEMEANDGTLTDATFEKFEKAGIPKQMVEGYIEGQKALAQQLTTTVHGLAGGEKAFSEMAEWAKAGLSTEDAQAFNAAMESGDMARIKMAVGSLKSAFVAENGSAPSLVRDANMGIPAGVKPFASNEEMVRAMQDRRYKEGDPAYHAEVQKRIAAGLR